ncbi:hypothetical protein THAOC_05411 [Thalassiosira oceanica]|uniref:Uncharacterized protein n=1 Tax=Thalassiosira oceanica TaxID=159749 RepID=K0TMU7_THAOC|nr:hypothetical protein THAOC_05411 [Thalassiosira oceanica]|eukprot:EJK72997.1 hypothetical protein THAOC_05411 [Thalassiosira oceanica]
MEDLDAGNDASGPGGGTAASSSSGHAPGGRSTNPHRRSGASRTALGSPLDAALQRKRREQAYLVAAMQVREGEKGIGIDPVRSVPRPLPEGPHADLPRPLRPAVQPPLGPRRAVRHDAPAPHAGRRAEPAQVHVDHNKAAEEAAQPQDIHEEGADAGGVL